MTANVLNRINNIEKLRYLELASYETENYDAIKCRYKYAVHSVIDCSDRFVGTTDEFFKQLPPYMMYDLIYIDANHNYDQLLQDYNNSIQHCTKWILISKLIPYAPEFTEPNLFSDGYKLLYYLLTETDSKVYPSSYNSGLTLVQLPTQRINPSEKFRQISYNDFISMLKYRTLYSIEQLIEILNK